MLLVMISGGWRFEIINDSAMLSTCFGGIDDLAELIGMEVAMLGESPMIANDVVVVAD